MNTKKNIVYGAAILILAIAVDILLWNLVFANTILQNVAKVDITPYKKVIPYLSALNSFPAFVAYIIWFFCETPKTKKTYLKNKQNEILVMVIVFVLCVALPELVLLVSGYLRYFAASLLLSVLSSIFMAGVSYFCMLKFNHFK